MSFDFDPCSLTVLGINDFRQRSVLRLNDTAHLIGLSGDETRLPGVKT